MAQQIAVRVEFEFGDGGAEVVTVAARDGIDDAAQEFFMGRELRDGVRKLVQIGGFHIFARQAAELS